MRRLAVLGAAAVLLASLFASCSDDGGEENPLEGFGDRRDPDGTTFVALFEAHDLAGVDPDDVVATMQERAANDQEAALAFAEEAGVTARSSWLANALMVEGSAELGEALTLLPGVELVAEEPVPPPAEGHQLDPAGVPTGTAWHVEAVGGPEAWEADLDGGDVVVGIIDTGVDGSHDALSGQFVGDGGWLDLTGDCAAPCDEVGHGTAAAGLVLAGDGPGPEADLGLAHSARWLAARACTESGCAFTDLLAATEWLLAPDGDADLRPDVVSGSWGAPPGAPGYGRIVRALEAAGVVVVLAAGNDGPTCASVETPADQPEALAVGSVDRAGQIDPRSSRGPAGDAEAESVVLKPDLVAPGMDVMTTAPDGEFATATGTSFAAPLVAGAAALLLDARPELAGDPAAVREALVAGAALPEPDAVCNEAGRPPDGPNQTFGAGHLDVAAALEALD